VKEPKFPPPDKNGAKTFFVALIAVVLLATGRIGLKLFLHSRQNLQPANNAEEQLVRDAVLANADDPDSVRFASFESWNPRRDPEMIALFKQATDLGLGAKVAEVKDATVIECCYQAKNKHGALELFRVYGVAEAGHFTFYGSHPDFHGNVRSLMLAVKLKWQEDVGKARQKQEAEDQIVSEQERRVEQAHERREQIPKKR
jgi:hypothetical protein